MYHLSTLLAILAATSVSSLPLNINLGAFSPALVVGDGEISFGGEADVSSLMTALSGASQTASTTANPEEVKQAGVVIPASPIVETQPSASPSFVPLAQGLGRAIEPRLPEALADNLSVEKEKREAGEEEKREVTERDLAGFNAALNFAAGALKTGPEVQLGTGEGGSGVGIIVKPADAGAAAEKIGKREEKREDGSLPTVTMIKLRTIGDSSAVSKRDVVSRSEDGVNLNLRGDGQEYELMIAEVKP